MIFQPPKLVWVCLFVCLLKAPLSINLLAKIQNRYFQIFEVTLKLDRFFFKVDNLLLKTFCNGFLSFFLSFFLFSFFLSFFLIHSHSGTQSHIYIYIYIYMCVCVCVCVCVCARVSVCVCVKLGNSLSFKHVWLNNNGTFYLYNYIKILSSFLISVLDWNLLMNLPKLSRTLPDFS